MDILNVLNNLGIYSIDILWLPVALWTILALGAMGLMKLSSKAHSFYQYHGRIALLIALPAGILFSWINQWLNSLGEAGQPFATKFIVIQSPVSVSATSAAPTTLNWLEPGILTGILTGFFLLVAAVLLLKIAADLISLRSFSHKLTREPLSAISGISETNCALAHKLGASVYAAFSGRVEIPFTYGWRNPVIVVPEEQQKNKQKMNMAIRHELMHIRHHDYVLNSFIMIVKAIFWFHPLVQKLYKSFKEYREISCDSEVLSDGSISKKGYAELLLELAPKSTFKNTPAVSMAVNPSTLKKRLQVMSRQTNKPNIFKTSFYMMLVSALLLTGIIACSDIQDGGITNKDIENAQAEMQTTHSPSKQPLYIINGKEIESAEYQELFTRIKPKYIESIEVFKGEKARELYGEKGSNGVIKLKLLDKEKAFEDLKESAPVRSTRPFDANKDYYVVVEEMPELIGGLEAVQECVEYPETAKKAGIEGRVIIQFIVNENGQVENPNIIRGIGGGADREALRCVKQAEFKPGKQRGQPVRVQYSLPIIFKLSNNDSIQKNDPDVYIESYEVDGKDMEIRNLAYKQVGTIEGYVFDKKNNKPLPGANIILVSTNKGTVTNQNGKFILTDIDASNPQIRISYVGYEFMTIKLQK